jgi:RNA polymerase sigma factor (sigma-70 family)
MVEGTRTAIVATGRHRALPSSDMGSDLGPMVTAAVGGDQGAWNSLVDRFAGLIWTVARSFRLSAADAADVSQVTWLRVVEHLGTVRDPDALAAWIATTARREALQLLRRRREVPVDDLTWIDAADDNDRAPDRRLVRDDRDRELWEAYQRLPVRCRTLLRLLVIEPAGSYAAVSAALDMPIGSLGPARGRCLDALRRELRTSEEVTR